MFHINIKILLLRFHHVKNFKPKHSKICNYIETDTNFIHA